MSAKPMWRCRTYNKKDDVSGMQDLLYRERGGRSNIYAFPVSRLIRLLKGTTLIPRIQRLIYTKPTDAIMRVNMYTAFRG